MPELIEVERYRSLVEARALGRRVASVQAPDPWYLKDGLDHRALADVLTGTWFTSCGRHGKLLMATTDRGPVLGLRFGMTGRLIVDGYAAIEKLEYASARAEPRWDRLVVHFVDGGDLRVRDPRRLGGVLVDPDRSGLGPDAATLTAGELARALARSRTSLKAFLLDQSRVAGLGNLMADEALWRAGLDPARSASSLDDDEMRRMHGAVRETVRVLERRGGAHTGDLQPERRPGGMCPADGAPLTRRRIGGRTTWSCPVHQQ